MQTGHLAGRTRYRALGQEPSQKEALCRRARRHSETPQERGPGGAPILGRSPGVAGALGRPPRWLGDSPSWGHAPTCDYLHCPYCRKSSDHPLSVVEGMIRIPPGRPRRDRQVWGPRGRRCGRACGSFLATTTKRSLCATTTSTSGTTCPGRTAKGGGAPNLLVLARRQGHRLRALPASPHSQTSHLRRGPRVLAHVLDALVDLAKERPAPRDPLLSRHDGSLGDDHAHEAVLDPDLEGVHGQVRRQGQRSCPCARRSVIRAEGRSPRTQQARSHPRKAARRRGEHRSSIA